MPGDTRAQSGTTSSAHGQRLRSHGWQLINQLHGFSASRRSPKQQPLPSYSKSWSLIYEESHLVKQCKEHRQNIKSCVERCLRTHRIGAISFKWTKPLKNIKRTMWRRKCTNSLIAYGLVFTVVFWTLYASVEYSSRQAHFDVKNIRPAERYAIVKDLTPNSTQKAAIHPANGAALNEHAGGQTLRPQEVDRKLPPQLDAHVYDMHKFSSEVRDIYFVKVHKAGSTTVQNMLYRFGLNRNLLFALFNCPNGMPFPQVASPRYLIKDRFHNQFNIMCDHARYDETVHSEYMPTGTVTLGILRNPLEQLRSSIAFHGLASPMKLTGSDPTSQFLSNPAFHDSRIAFTGSSIQCGPLVRSSFTQNGMAYHFGYTKQKNNSDERIAEFLIQMDNKIDLMLILERFDESVVLLKRMFHWKTQDILNLPLFSTVSFGKNAMKRERNDLAKEQLVKKHRAWSCADYALYYYFSAKMEATIADQPPDFSLEVQLFRLIKEKVVTHCRSMCSAEFVQKLRVERSAAKARQILVSNSITIAASDWNEAFTVTYINCLSMMMGTLEYQGALRNKQAFKNCSTGPKIQSQSQQHHCDDDKINYLFYTFDWVSIQKRVFKDARSCLKYSS